jgi:hypothetical protein
VVAYLVVGLVVWTMFTTTTPDSQLVGDVFALTAVLGTPLAAAAAILARRLAAAGRGADLAERVVALAGAGLDRSDGAWAAAMRAELASIDERRERRRFALGCAVASVRTGLGWAVWVPALGTGAFVATGVFVASRVSLAGAREGIIGIFLFWGVPGLFAVGLLAAGTARSFRIGLVTGGLGLLAAVAATAAVSMVEAAHWYHVAGVFVMDGDIPKGGGLDLRTAVLDPLRFLVPVLLLWTPWPVLGAAAGERLTRSARTEAEPAAPAAPSGSTGSAI